MIVLEQLRERREAVGVPRLLLRPVERPPRLLCSRQQLHELTPAVDAPRRCLAGSRTLTGFEQADRARAVPAAVPASEFEDPVRGFSIPAIVHSASPSER